MANVMNIAGATEKEIEFKDGTKLRPGMRVQLPPVAGNKLGTVDYIQMVFYPEELKAEIHLRIVALNGQGHLFKFPAE
jgi:hypothetical protein